MALPMSVLRNKDEIMKEREGSRLSRYLRILFGSAKFGFYWTSAETSYTDGKDIYIIYNVQRPDCRSFDLHEQRVIRKAHAIHERGHLEYDCIDDYRNWLQVHHTLNPSDWISNLKYPIAWLQFFGNVLMDGRMELLTATEKPTTAEYLDFCNYEWAFGQREAGIGEETISDFRSCFMHRSLGMTDVPGWLPESVNLVDSIQPLIDRARQTTSTASCLDVVLEIIKSVWPKLLEWMDTGGQQPNDFEYVDPHENAQWGTKETTDENSKRAAAILVTAPAPKREDGEKPDFSSTLRLEQKQLEKDQKDTQEETAPYECRTEGIQLRLNNGTVTSSEVDIGLYYRSDLASYLTSYNAVRRHIAPTARALSELLQPILDKKRCNQRSGSVMISRAWRANYLADSNVFERNEKGKPAKQARILLQTDISGSTGRSDFNGSRRIDEMRRATVLMVEACEKAGIPVASYGFTEMDLEDGRGCRSKIFPFKPFGRFSNTEKSLIGGMEPEIGNRDTLALQWSINEIAKYREDIRLLIMLSDGQPCFSAGEDKDTIRDIVLAADKQGIDVLCLYIGPRDARSLQSVQHMYPGRSIIVEKNLSRDLTTHVKRIIRNRK